MVQIATPGVAARTGRSREGVEISLNMPGRYALASRRDPEGNRREFGCRVMTMSPISMVLVAPVLGPIGERVIVHLERFGRLQGKIVRVLRHGFAMTITTTDGERGKLAGKLVWLDRHRKSAVPDTRRHDRVVPRTPITTLTLPGGITMSCLIIDISASGAAVSADCIPDIGLPVSIGPTRGRVVREFTEGFAVEFERVLSPHLLDQTYIDR